MGIAFVRYVEARPTQFADSSFDGVPALLISPELQALAYLSIEPAPVLACSDSGCVTAACPAGSGLRPRRRAGGWVGWRLHDQLMPG